MNRNGIDINKYLEKYNKDNFIVLDNYPSLDLSSTGVRVNNKNEFLDPKVLNYIKKNGLYERNSKKTN
jgi:nicotinic acid mononucleotide adenylyltransferase